MLRIASGAPDLCHLIWAQIILLEDGLFFSNSEITSSFQKNKVYKCKAKKYSLIHNLAVEGL